jgi:hypothetical protein
MCDEDADCLEAFSTQPDAVDGDGPTEVATYELVESHLLEKVTKVSDHIPESER